MLTLCWIVVLLVCTSINLSDGNDHAKRGFVFIAPKRLLADSLETVCLSLHNRTTPAFVVLDLLHAENDERIASTQHTIYEANGDCMDLFIPATMEIRGRLHLKIHFEHDVDYTINSIKEVHIQHDPTITFIETDKSVYKPGQLVQIRILTLRNDLRPLLNEPIPKVWIENPSEVRVAQWTNLTTEMGMIQISFSLSHEPMMGTWSIKLEKKNPNLPKEIKYFQVKKYVLPRFEVKIHYDENILADTDTVKWQICAKYSYGQPVKGQLHVKIFPETPAWRMWKKSKQPDINLLRNVTTKDGCQLIEVSGIELGLREWEIAPSHIFLTASYEEAGTGRVENSTAKSTVLHQALKIDFQPYSPQYFKPVLPYIGKLHVSYTTDKDKIAFNETIQLCLRVRARNEWRKILVECKNFTTDSEGFIDFLIPPQHKNIVLLSFVAVAVNYQTKYYSQEKRWRIFMDQASSMFTVRSWYSPTDSYIELITDVSKAAECGKPLIYFAYFTVSVTNETKAFEDNPPTFFYTIKSRGDLVKFGTIETSQIQTVNPEDFKNYEHLLGTVDGASILEAAPLNDSISNHTKQATISIKKIVLTVEVVAKMSPVSSLLVYYSRSDGEMVATSTVITVKECLSNKIKVHWKENQLFPGEKATLNIKASPRSLCSISAIDKAVSFLSPSGPTTITKNQIFDELARFQIRENTPPSQINALNCQKPKSQSKYSIEDDLEEESFDGPIAMPIIEEPSFWDLGRRKRMSEIWDYPNNPYVDAINAFDDFGVIVISDLVLETRPCADRRRKHKSVFGDLQIVALPRSGVLYYNIPPPFSPPAYLEHAPDRSAAIRNFFPETWLWDLVPVGTTGEVEIERTIPHSITDWMTSVSCISHQSGLGIAHKTHIRGYQPFFLDFVTPYSIKRGEVVHLKVILFNYLLQELPVQIKLVEVNSGLKLISESANVTSCVEGRANFVHDFKIMAQTLGKINITVIAEVDPMYPSPCGSEFLVNYRDVLVKPLLVQPEGFPVEISNSAFVCKNGSSRSQAASIIWNLNLPIDVVSESARAKISVIADILGPALQNLDKLVKLPMGCGEQNMILFVPNIHVINYLNSTGIYNPVLQGEALKNMKKGYERQLNYRHSDGSYSAFGAQDIEGSMWLTAFVVRSFAQARFFMYIDETDLKHSIRWIVKKQLENGCFPTIGTVFHKEMKGGLTSTGGNDDASNTAALTAYVLISLIETGYSLQPTISKNAKFCLTANKDVNPYTQILTTYAFTLLNMQEEAKQGLEQLMTIAKREDDLIWWENDANPSLALSIEMTAYAILILMKHKNVDNMMYVLQAIRWISKHRNGQGGFISTQDTIVALEALSKYAALMPNNRGTNLQIEINALEIQEEITVTDMNRLLLKQIYLPKLPTAVTLLVYGTGCVLLQGILRYNNHRAFGSDVFGLEVQVEPVNTHNYCTVQELNICAWYRIGDESSNMAVLEVSMVTGYEVTKESLEKVLVQGVNSNVKRFEEDRNKINIYLSELTGTKTCVSLQVDQQTQVDNRMPAIVRVYDYYHPQLEKTMSYKLESRCKVGTVPHKEPDEKSNRGNTFRNSLLVQENPLNVIPIVSQFSSTEKDQLTSPAVDVTNTPMNDFDHTSQNFENDNNMLTLSSHEFDKETGEEKNNENLLMTTGLNPNFVDFDIDLATPEGIEGPSPVYVSTPREFFSSTNFPSTITRVSRTSLVTKLWTPTFNMRSSLNPLNSLSSRKTSTVTTLSSPITTTYIPTTTTTETTPTTTPTTTSTTTTSPTTTPPTTTPPTTTTTPKTTSTSTTSTTSTTTTPPTPTTTTTTTTQRTTAKMEEKDCPRCYSSLPEDITDLYCDQKYAYKIGIKAHNNVKILYSFSPFEKSKKLRNTVKLFVEEYCNCPTLKKKGSSTGHVMVLDTEYRNNKGLESLESSDNTTVITLGRTAHLFPIDMVHGAPSIIVRAQKYCQP